MILGSIGIIDSVKQMAPVSYSKSVIISNIYTSSTQVETSPNGSTWTDTGFSIGGTWNDVIWVESLGSFYLIGGSTTFAPQKLYKSPDGIVWTQVVTTNFSTGGTPRKIVYSPELAMFICVRTPGSFSDGIKYSYDGVNWVDVVGSADFRAAIWIKELGLFIVGGALVWVSSDGINWNNTATATSGVTDFAWSPSLGRVVLTSSSSSYSYRTWYSTNGTTWTNGGIFTSASFPCYSIAWSPTLGKFAVGSGNQMWISSDGIFWGTFSYSVPFDARSTIWAGDKFITANGDGSSPLTDIATSVNGTTWLTHSSNSGTGGGSFGGIGYGDTTPIVDADAAAYIDAVISAGGSVSVAIQAAINTFYIGLKAAGVWDKILDFWPIIGATGASHAINGKTPGTRNIEFYGGWTHSDAGALGDGVNAYADTVPTLTRYVEGDKSVITYNTAAVTYDAGGWEGVWDDTSAGGVWGMSLDTSTVGLGLNNLAGGLGSITGNQGVWIGTITGGTGVFYRNREIVFSNSGTSPMDNSLMYTLNALNISGSLGYFNIYNYVFHAAAYYLNPTQVIAVTGLINNLQIACGRNTF